MRFNNYILNENDTFNTKKDGTGHTHDVSVNADGDGKTISTKGSEDHEHIVFQWLVQPSHGHVHNMEI